MKIEFTGEPVIITDVLLLNIIKDLFKIINESIGIWIILFFVLTILFGFFIFVIIMCSKEYINNKVSGKIENIICIISLALLLLLCIPNYHINNFILNNIYDKNKIVDYNLQSWTNYLYYINNGIIGGTYGKYLESIEYKPNNYKENLVKEIIDNQDSKKTNEDDWGKPNIIMILAESFYDIQNTGLIEFNKELTSNFDRIKSNSTSINLLSPCYGGITANVEFEVMTGSNISNYPNGTIPYMYKYSNANNNYPSIIKELNNNGYYTAYLTPTYPYFFNRKNVYDSMGIDEFISTDELDYIQYVQNTISD